MTKRKFKNRMKKAGLRYLLVYFGHPFVRNDSSFYMASNDVELLDRIAISCFGKHIFDANLSYVERIN